MASDRIRPLVVEFTPRAAREMLEAARWWRSNRPAASGMLDEAIAQALARIASFPQSGILVRGRDVRRTVLRGCGYLLFYRVRERAGRIDVVSLWHGRRGGDPRDGR